MNLKILITVSFFSVFCLLSKATELGRYIQSSKTNEDNTIPQGWKAETTLGFDFLSNIFVNPKAGAGENRITIGFNGSVLTNYNFGRLSCTNQLQLAYGVQKTGNGFLEDYPSVKIPFKKNTDRFLFNSKVAYRASYFSKYYYTGNVSFNSQLAKTYPENYVRAINASFNPIAQFLAPATLQIDLGIDYRHDTFLSIFFTPLSFKSIIVNNDSIASSAVCDEDQNIVGAVHGNKLWTVGDNIYFKNANNQIGAAFRLKYENTFFKDRVALNTSLDLFSNYLKSANKKNDVVWRNEASLKLFKMLSLALYSELTFDDDIFLLNGTPSKSNCERTPHTENPYKKGLSYTQQLFLKFKYCF